MESLVSIIIVNWNAKDYIKQCIDSLLLQSYKNFEIIIVDNASTDNSVAIIKQNYPQVTLIENKDNLGFSAGNNIGIKESKGTLIALFNPDAVAEKDWLQRLVSIVENSENIGGASGKIFYLGDKYGKDAVFCTWSKINPYSAIPTNFYDNEPISTVDYLSGAAVLFKKSVFDKIGLLDTKYFLYFEETDLCARMIRAGYNLMYVPTAIAWHAVSPLSNSENKIYYMERNRFRFALKNFDLKYIPIFIVYYLSESFIIFLRDIKNRNLTRSKIRSRALNWNLINFVHIWKDRAQDFSLIKKHGVFKSYNNSLPLHGIKNKQ